MMHMPSTTAVPRRQSGFTLIELLVAITIGLFIVGAALMVFQNTSGIGRQISELTSLRQDGAHAFRVIGKQVREAGSIEPAYNPDNNNFSFASEYTWASGSTPIANWVSPPTSEDTLSISPQLLSNAAYTEILRNCLGEKVTTTVNRNDFYVSNGNLMCITGSNTGGQPVVNNVNAFKVRYRQRISDTSAQFLTTPTDWSEVDAVEVCLDLMGTKPTPTNGANYTDCDGNSVSQGNRLHVVQRNLFTVFTSQR